MPITPGCQPSPTAKTRAARAGAGALDLGGRRRLHLGLDGPPLLVVGVEARRQGRGFAGVAGRQQLGAQPGLADAAAGVDPWPEQEAGMVGGRRLMDVNDVGQRREPGIPAPCHHLEALGDERPVDADEGHDVADRAEGHEVQERQQVRLGPVGVVAGRAQRAVESDDEQERDTDGGELAEAARVVEPVRVDHGGGRRQLRLGHVMVDDDDVEAGPVAAAASGSNAVMPQSTVTTTLTPSARNCSSAPVLGP